MKKIKPVCVLKRVIDDLIDEKLLDPKPVYEQDMYECGNFVDPFIRNLMEKDIPIISYLLDLQFNPIRKYHQRARRIASDKECDYYYNDGYVDYTEGYLFITGNIHCYQKNNNSHH